MQYQNDQDLSLFLYYNKNEFVVGKKGKNPKIYFRAKNSGELRCPFPRDGWQQLSGSDWMDGPDVRVKCYRPPTRKTTKAATTTIPPTTTVATTVTMTEITQMSEELQAELLEELLSSDLLPSVQLKQGGRFSGTTILPEMVGSEVRLKRSEETTAPPQTTVTVSLGTPPTNPHDHSHLNGTGLGN